MIKIRVFRTGDPNHYLNEKPVVLCAPPAGPVSGGVYAKRIVPVGKTTASAVYEGGCGVRPERIADKWTQNDDGNEYYNADVSYSERLVKRKQSTCRRHIQG